MYCSLFICLMLFLAVASLEAELALKAEQLEVELAVEAEQLEAELAVEAEQLEAELAVQAEQLEAKQIYKHVGQGLRTREPVQVLLLMLYLHCKIVKNKKKPSYYLLNII